MSDDEDLEEFEAAEERGRANSVRRAIDRLEDNGGDDLDQNEILIEVLAAGANYKAAGMMAGMSPRTVRRRMADHLFREEVRRRRTERFQQQLARMTDLVDQAYGVAWNALSSEDERVQLSAARLVFGSAVKLAALDGAFERHIRRGAPSQRSDLNVGDVVAAADDPGPIEPYPLRSVPVTDVANGDFSGQSRPSAAMNDPSRERGTTRTPAEEEDSS